jgi:hypothetical protein
VRLDAVSRPRKRRLWSIAKQLGLAVCRRSLLCCESQPGFADLEANRSPHSEIPALGSGPVFWPCEDSFSGGFRLGTRPPGAVRQGLDPNGIWNFRLRNQIAETASCWLDGELMGKGEKTCPKPTYVGAASGRAGLVCSDIGEGTQGIEYDTC